MNDKVRIVNETGLAHDTKVYIGKKQIPLTKMFKLGLVIDSDDVNRVHLELYAESIDVIGNGLKAIAKVLDEGKQ